MTTENLLYGKEYYSTFQELFPQLAVSLSMGPRSITLTIPTLTGFEYQPGMSVTPMRICDMYLESLRTVPTIQSPNGYTLRWQHGTLSLDLSFSSPVGCPWCSRCLNNHYPMCPQKYKKNDE